ncbi:hypothetical protein MNBD_BACTEROID03-2570 [hydrothermal vent metagenome]|uniref:Uncharacterized protein n=1 Tax=hydrothermal vent metagenome TaxID=652676 RepID=A0A3B0T0H7_9ZZZZ
MINEKLPHPEASGCGKMKREEYNHLKKQYVY